MSLATFTKTGNKATTAAKLDKTVFGVTIANHDLLKQAYLAYLANGRENLAVTKTRGLIRGGGKKPWRQKGTGRARFGSSRNPIWRGGGIVFGPTGEENYTHKLPVAIKRTALRQALTLASEASKVAVLEAFDNKESKTSKTADLLAKIGTSGSVLFVVETKDDTVERATRNLSGLHVVQAKYLNVFDILNADHVIITSGALKIVQEWLGTKPVTRATKETTA